MQRAAAIVASFVAVTLWLPLVAAPAYAGASLPWNVGFEAGQGTTGLVGTHWGTGDNPTCSTSSVKVHGGNQSWTMNQGGNDEGCEYQPGSGTMNTPAVVAGHTYYVGVWIWVSSGLATYSDRNICVNSDSIGGFGCGPATSTLVAGALSGGQWVKSEITYAPQSSVTDLRIRFYRAFGGPQLYYDDFYFIDGGTNGTTTTVAASGSGSTCTTTATGACKVDVTGDSGGFFGGLLSGIGGIAGSVGSVLSSPLNAIKDAVTSLGSVIVNGFQTVMQTLFQPSQSTSDGWSHMWDTMTTKFPFSVISELVQLPANVLSAVSSGIGAGPPSSCDTTYLCSVSGTGTLHDLATMGSVQTARTVVLFILVAAFGYGVLRSIGEAVK